MFFESWVSFLALIGSAWSLVNFSFCVSRNFAFLLIFLSLPWWHWNWLLPRNKYSVPVNLIWFLPLLFSQQMKGNFDDDERISRKDAEKETFWSKSGIFLMNYPAFVTICLFINRGDSRSGKNTLHKEKKRKRNNWSYCTNEKYFS